VLCRELECQVRSREHIAQVNRRVLYVLRFQDTKDRILQFRGVNENAGRKRRLQVEMGLILRASRTYPYKATAGSSPSARPAE
jgi:hypothetical protein